MPPLNLNKKGLDEQEIQEKTTLIKEEINRMKKLFSLVALHCKLNERRNERGKNFYRIPNFFGSVILMSVQ